MADSFNPQANLPREQNFLNYSRGYRDSSLGDFIGGTAQAVGTGLEALDRGVAQKAEDDVRATVDETDSQLLGIKNQPPAIDPLDKEVRTQVQNLEGKKLAMDAGTIDPQHYYATITAKVKDIRARYAGYNDTIDSELTKLGIDPNWQRKQIIEEGIKAQNARAGAAQEAAKNNREFAEKWMTDPKIIMDPQMRVDYANDPNWAQNPTNMNKLKLAIGNTQNIYSQAEMNKLKADTASSDNKDNARNTAIAYRNSLDTIFYAGATNGGIIDVLKKQIQLSQNDNSMGTPNADHQAALLDAYRKYRTQMVLSKQQVEAHYSDSPWEWSDEKKKVDDAFNARLEMMDKALNDKDWGLLNAIAINNKAKVEGGKKDLLESDFTTKLAAGSDLGVGTAMLSAAASKNASIPDVLAQDLLNGLQVDQVTGKAKSLNDMFKQGQAQGVTDKKFYQNGFAQSVDWINGKDNPTKSRLSVFETMFGKENQAWWDNMVTNKNLSDSDKRAYYRVLTSPQMQQSVKDLSQIDRQAGTKYYQYVSYMFGKLTQDSASTLNNIIQNSGSQSIQYDPNTHHLVITDRTNPDSTILGRFFDNFRGGEEAVENWNQGIDALVPLWKEQGIDPNVAATTILQRQGVDLNAQFQGNAVDNFINSSAGENEVKLPTIDENGNYVQPSKLGGPGMSDGGNTQNTQSIQDQVEARSGILSELGEMNKLYSSTEDPKLKEVYRQHIDELLQDYKNARQGLPSGTSNELEDSGRQLNRNTPSQVGPSQLGGPENMNTTSGEQEPGLSSPDATVAKFMADFVPGKTLVDAVQTGDSKEIVKELALTGASVLPVGKLFTLIAEKFGVKVAQKIRLDDLADLYEAPKKYDGSFPIPEIGSQGKLTQAAEKYTPSNKGIASANRNNIVEDGGNVVQFPGNSKAPVLSNQEGNVTSLEGRKVADEMDKVKSTKDNPRAWYSDGSPIKVRLTPEDMKAGINYSDKVWQQYGLDQNIMVPYRALTDSEKTMFEKLKQLDVNYRLAKEQGKDPEGYARAQFMQQYNKLEKHFNKE